MALKSVLGGLEPRRLAQVVELVWNNKDDLLRSAAVASELPRLLSTLAAGLEEAGGQARAASAALVGEDGTSGATTRLTSSAHADTARIRRALSPQVATPCSPR